MNSYILFQQLLVLLAMIITGFAAYKTHLVDDVTNAHLSSLLLWILNPMMMIGGVIGKDTKISSSMIIQNLLMVGLLYVGAFALGFLFVVLTRCSEREYYLYRYLLLFPNVGFMGIPLVKEMFGSDYIVLVAFYMLVFNIMIYTYGIHLASRIGGKKEKLNLKKLLSPGTFASALSIIIFCFHLSLPVPAVSYLNYLTDATIVFSMIIVGVFLAKQDFRTMFRSGKNLLFVLFDMFIVPGILIFLSRFLPFDRGVIGVFQIICCMPVATMTCMMAQEFAGDGTDCATIIAISTVVTVISAPLVIMIAG